MKLPDNKSVVFIAGMVFMAAIIMIWGWNHSFSRLPGSFEEAVVIRAAAQEKERELRAEYVKKCNFGPYCHLGIHGGRELQKRVVGYGAFLTDFKKVIIYYKSFEDRLPKNSKAIGIDLLKYQKFHNLLVQSLEKNLAGCFYSQLGSSKPVMVIPPNRIDGQNLNKEELAKNVEDIKQVSNPENLTVLVSFYPVVANDDKPDSEGFTKLYELSYEMFRPNLPESDELQRLRQRGKILFDLSRAVDIEASLNKVFKRMVPWQCKPEPDPSLAPKDGGAIKF